MPLVTNADDSWRTFAPSAAGLIRVFDGTIRFTAGAAPGATDGIPCGPGESLPISAAGTVSYRLQSGNSGRFVWEVL